MPGMTGSEIALIITAVGGLIIGIISAIGSVVAAVYAALAKAKAEVVDSRVATIAVKQEKQHEEINGKLAEKDRLTIAAKIAEGIILGRKELQAELDAKAVAVAEGARISQAAPVVSPTIPPQLSASNAGIAQEVVSQIAAASEHNKNAPKKEQIAVTLPPGPPQPLH